MSHARSRTHLPSGDRYAETIMADRDAKDVHFLTAADSPLRGPDARLHPLDYFRWTSATGYSSRGSGAPRRARGRSC